MLSKSRGKTLVLVFGLVLLPFVLCGFIRQLFDGHFSGIDTIVIESSPAGAAVYKNGEYKGESPCKLSLRYSGDTGESFSVTIKKTGYKTRETRISRDDLWPKWNSGAYQSGSVFGKGNTFTFHYALEKDPAYAVPPKPAVAPTIPGSKGIEHAPPVKSSSGHRRIALLIGNGDYREIPLKNPMNDARDMAAALKSLGFEVMLLVNANKKEMVTAIQDFGNRVADSVALFFYAGHGMQIRGENYLIPIGARISSEPDVEFECVPVARLLSQLDYQKSHLNIVILDACRNNPIARSFRSYHRGLAMVSAPKGTIIAYATSPGQVAHDGEGRNSVYTQYLLKYINRPGMSIERYFKVVGQSVSEETMGVQRPWISSDFFDEFSFTVR